MISYTQKILHLTIQKQSSKILRNCFDLVTNAYPSDPNQTLIMELWANALENLGKLDVAINKAENAIAMADSVSSKDLIHFDVMMMNMKQRNGSNKF